MPAAAESPAGRASAPPSGDSPRAAETPRRRFLESHPWLVDSVIALVYTVPVFADRVYAIVTGDPLVTPWHVLAVLLTGAALLFRRHRPLTVLATVTVLTAILNWPPHADGDTFAILLALYAVAVYRSPRIGWIAAAVELVVAGAGIQALALLLEAAAGADPETQLNLLLLRAGSDAVAVLIGTAVYNRRQWLAAIIDRADRLARERDNQVQLATLAERSRIAREMHDIVAHSLSVMVALADGAAAATGRNPEQAKRALEELSETGRSALGDMRRLLGVLSETTDPSAGDEPRELQPTPGHRELAGLVERFRSANLPVALAVTGVPAESAAVELTVYRIVQEGLTNVLRYAVDPQVVRVVVEYSRSEVAVTVTDDGRWNHAATASVGAGRGIIGMTERAAVHGGQVSAGPRANGGWEVRAVLPMERNLEGREAP